MADRTHWIAPALSLLLALSALGVVPAVLAQDEPRLKAPVPDGIELVVIHGYDDPPVGSTCTG